MLLSALKNNRGVNLLLIPLAGSALLLSSLLEGASERAQQIFHISPFIDPFFDFGGRGIYSVLGAWLFAMLLCILVTAINTRFSVIKERTYLPAYIILLLISAYPAMHVVQPIYFASVFCTLSLFPLFTALDKKDIVINIFESESLISIASFFYLPSILFAFLPAIAIGYTQCKLRWREFFSIIWGIITPWLFIFTIYFLVDEVESLTDLFAQHFSANFSLPIHNLYSIVFLSILALFSVISMFSLIRQYNTLKISNRKIDMIIVFFFMIILGIKLIPGTHSELIAFLAVPLSLLFANHLYFSKRKFWNELFFIVLFASSLVMQYLMR